MCGCGCELALAMAEHRIALAGGQHLKKHAGPAQAPADGECQRQQRGGRVASAGLSALQAWLVLLHAKWRRRS